MILLCDLGDDCERLNLGSNIAVIVWVWRIYPVAFFIEKLEFGLEFW